MYFQFSFDPNNFEKLDSLGLSASNKRGLYYYYSKAFADSATKLSKETINQRFVYRVLLISKVDRRKN
jgi:hypothetical protein